VLFPSAAVAEEQRRGGALGVGREEKEGSRISMLSSHLEARRTEEFAAAVPREPWRMRTPPRDRATPS